VVLGVHQRYSIQSSLEPDLSGMVSAVGGSREGLRSFPATTEGALPHFRL